MGQWSWAQNWSISTVDDPFKFPSNFFFIFSLNDDFTKTKPEGQMGGHLPRVFELGPCQRDDRNRPAGYSRIVVVCVFGFHLPRNSPSRKALARVADPCWKNIQSSRQNPPSHVLFQSKHQQSCPQIKSLPLQPRTNEQELEAMDLSDIARKLGFSDSKPLLLRKAQELRRLCDVHFDSSILGIVSISHSIRRSIYLSLSFFFFFPFLTDEGSLLCSVQGEVCKGIICLEIAASRYLLYSMKPDFFFLLGFCWFDERFGSTDWFGGKSRMQVLFDRQNAIRLSGMSEKGYNRSFNALQNGLGVKWVLSISLNLQFNWLRWISISTDYVMVFVCRTKLDIRELGIQFGCVRLIPFVQKGLSL